MKANIKIKNGCFSDVKSAKTFIFDFDGVILNSNQLKENIFRILALNWSLNSAEKLLELVRAKKGKSRFELFNYFVNVILPSEGFSYVDDEREKIASDLVNKFAEEMESRLKNCQIADRLSELRSFFSNQNWMIVSAGVESEIINVLNYRKVISLFNGGIYGAPLTKLEIINKLHYEGKISNPTILFGDSQSDYEAAKHAGIEFMFVSGWTEDKEWADIVNVCQKNRIEKISDLLT